MEDATVVPAKEMALTPSADITFSTSNISKGADMPALHGAPSTWRLNKVRLWSLMCEEGIEIEHYKTLGIYMERLQKGNTLGTFGRQARGVPNEADRHHKPVIRLDQCLEDSIADANITLLHELGHLAYQLDQPVIDPLYTRKNVVRNLRLGLGSTAIGLCMAGITTASIEYTADNMPYAGLSLAAIATICGYGSKKARKILYRCSKEEKYADDFAIKHRKRILLECDEIDNTEYK